VSPILVRPVREQLEHDRVIRLLQAKFRRRFDVGINPGAEQNSAVGAGGLTFYPDVVLLSPDRGRKVMAVIEVETVESVNNLEALAEWVPYGRLKSAFHLYVPAQMLDVARRLCNDSNIPVDEIHTYHWIGDEMRFLPVYKAPSDGRSVAARAAVSAKASPRPPAPVKASGAPGAAKTPARPVSAKASARPAAKAPARAATAKARPASARASARPARNGKGKKADQKKSVKKAGGSKRK
jgi:hypothetical protein